MSRPCLRAAPLTGPAFAPFGEVIETRDDPVLINRGTVQKFVDVASIDVTASGGRPQVNLYLATPYPLPIEVTHLERHPLSSQLFMPLEPHPFLVVVAPAAPAVDAGTVLAFLTDGKQGVCYRRGTWHHPLVALGRQTRFLVIDRAGPGANCDVAALSTAIGIEADPPG